MCVYSGSVRGSHGQHACLLRRGPGSRHGTDARRTRRVDNGSYPELSPGRPLGASPLMQTECRAMSEGDMAMLRGREVDRPIDAIHSAEPHARTRRSGTRARRTPPSPFQRGSSPTHAPRSTSLKGPRSTAGLATHAYMSSAPALICASRSHINLTGLSAS